MGYIYVWEHSGGGRHIDVDFSPTFEDLYNPKLDFRIFVSACVEVMTTLHGSAPSFQRCAKGCVPPKGSHFWSCLSLESYSWRRVGGRLIILASTLASIQEFMDHHPIGISTYEIVPHASQTAQVLPPGTSHGVPFHLSDHCETAPPYAAIMSPPIVSINDDTRLAEGKPGDGIPTASLPAKFHMPDIERYSGIGCPKIHLRLYNTIMRAHGIDDA
ncbi:hypothetical protein AAG906_030667 [Vitis piasezkii]